MKAYFQVTSVLASLEMARQYQKLMCISQIIWVEPAG